MIWKFASRYIRAKKSTQAINIISWVSIGAIAVGAAALITVLSVFNGFEDLVKSLYSSFYPEIKIEAQLGKTMLVSPSKLDSLRAFPEINQLSETLEEKALVQYSDEKMIVELKGVDRQYAEVTGVAQQLIRGGYDLGTVDTPKAIMGVGIESTLGVNVKHSVLPLSVYLPKPTAKNFSMPEQAFYIGDMIPVGAFAIQQDFDNKYVLTNLDFVQTLMSKPSDEISTIELSLVKGTNLEALKKEIGRLFSPKKFKIQTRFEQNQSLYLVMQTEKWAVYAILSFIFIIAAFNMIGALSMLVIEKKKDITILKAMGTPNRLIKRIFLSEGLLIAIIGAAAGTIIALVICLGQQHFGWVKLGGGSFVVDAYPVKMYFTDFFLVWTTIIIVALLASWYPANQAAKRAISLKGD